MIDRSYSGNRAPVDDLRDAGREVAGARERKTPFNDDENAHDQPNIRSPSRRSGAARWCRGCRNVTWRSLHFVVLSGGDGMSVDVSRCHVAVLAEDGVDALVGDVFFVVEGADVGGHEGFDAVPEPSRCFGERHPGA